MNIRKKAHFGLMTLLVAVLIQGCSGYGKIRANWGEKMTVGELLKTQDDYAVYYAGWYNNIPPCFMFDPKADDRKLIGQTWYKSEDPEWIADQMSWFRVVGRSFPIVERISGPDDRFYGFLYCVSEFNTVAKVVDENTLYIFDPFNYVNNEEPMI